MNREAWVVRFKYFCCDTGYHVKRHILRTRKEALALYESWRKDYDAGKFFGDGGAETMHEPIFCAELRCDDCDYPLEWTHQQYASDPDPRMVCRRCEYHDSRNESRLYGDD